MYKKKCFYFIKKLRWVWLANITLFIILLWTLSTISHALDANTQILLDAKTEGTVTIEVKEGGAFLLKNLNLTQKHGIINLYGDVVNNTNKDWYDATFKVYLYDSKGRLIQNDPLRFFFINFKKGETKSISFGTGVLLGSLKNHNFFVYKYEIRFHGEYLAKYYFCMIKPKKNDDLMFEDHAIKIQFSIATQQIGFILKNKTDDPIKIDWNQVSYVDVFNEAHKVIHSGVTYKDKNSPQAPTIIPPTAKLEDLIFPTDYVSYELNMWLKKPLFPPKASEANFYKGKTFSVFIPLEIKGVIKNYLFTFEIKDVEL